MHRPAFAPSGQRPSPGALALALLAAAVLGSSCRTVHENSVRTRLVELRLGQSVIPMDFESVTTVLEALPPTRAGYSCTALCRASSEVAADGVRTWCLSLWGASACLAARPEGPGTRFWSVRGTAAASVVSALWALLDPAGAREARTASDEEVMSLAEEEVQRFTPRWSFLGGVRTGIVSGDLNPVFALGAQAGFRYWASYYLIPGAAVEVEAVQLRTHAATVVGAQARLELAVWSDDNARFFNLPGLTFLMSVAPLIAIDSGVVFGGRATVGVHLVHLGPTPLPLFFEAGYQWLEPAERSASGLRVSLGVGF